MKIERKAWAMLRRRSKRSRWRLDTDAYRTQYAAIEGTYGPEPWRYVSAEALGLARAVRVTIVAAIPKEQGDETPYADKGRGPVYRRRDGQWVMCCPWCESRLESMEDDDGDYLQCPEGCNADGPKEQG